MSSSPIDTIKLNQLLTELNCQLWSLLSQSRTEVTRSEMTMSRHVVTGDSATGNTEHAHEMPTTSNILTASLEELDCLQQWRQSPCNKHSNSCFRTSPRYYLTQITTYVSGDGGWPLQIPQTNGMIPRC